MKKMLLFLLFALAAIGASPAAAGVSFSVSPIRVELSGDPGGTFADTIEVRNEGTDKIRIRIALQDWYLSEEGTPIFQKAGTQGRSCGAWMKINPVDFQIPPGEKKVVRYSVSVPDGIAPGGYWGSFLFETVPPVEPGQKTKSVSIKGNIASIIYVTVGKPAPTGDIIDMKYVPANGEDRVAVRMKNTGTAPFRLKGKVEFRDAAGKTAGSTDIPDVPVLPGTTRTITLAAPAKLAAGSYTAAATVDIGAKTLLSGELPFNVK